MRDYEFYYTQDGSIGLYSHADNDVYHSKFGALTEAWEKFILPLNIDENMSISGTLNVLDVCYGIGYNTKALMSYVLNHNEKFLRKKSFFEKLKIFIKNFSNKTRFLNNNIATIDDDNINQEKSELLLSDETIEEGLATHFNIDCLDINEDLIKFSPLLKTVITPQEIFTRIVPKIFSCFDTYWKIKKFLSKYSLKIAPRNKKSINELLDLKFDNEYETMDNEYKIHKFVNYIILNSLIKHYKNNYINKEFKKKMCERTNRPFFDKSLINYARFYQNFRYNLLDKLNLIAILHNIYYRHLSLRYKKLDFDKSCALFNLHFYPNDARKTVIKLDKQYDYIFLDAFTFSKAPELWTVEFIAELYKRLSPRGILVTYSNSALVRNTFIENNFYIVLTTIFIFNIF